MNMLFGALIGYIPMHIKDKRELAAKERLAAEERSLALENERKAKAYDERKYAYTEFLIAVENVSANSSSDDWSSMYKLSEKLGLVRLFCSDQVLVKAQLCENAMRTFLLQVRKTRQHASDEYAAYWNAYHELVSAMRLDLSVHQAELC